MGCAGSAVTPRGSDAGHAGHAPEAAGQAAPLESVDPGSRCLATVGLDDQLRWASAVPAWPYGEAGEGHAPLVVLDVGKGMKGIKSSFFKIFPRGKFMAVADFCSDDALLGKCVVLIHGGGEHKNYIGESEKEKLAEHLRRGGAIMTISAGGTFCGCNKGSLGLLPVMAHDRQHWQRGTGSVRLTRTPYGERLLPKIQEVESKYFNCPALLPLAEEHLRGAFGTTLPGLAILPILTYETEMNDCQSATSLLGLPAVLLGELGELGGRFVVISPNLEVNAGDVTIRLLRSLAAWASGGHLAPLVTGLGEAIQGPRFDQTCMTGTDRDGGELYTFPSASGKLPALSAECIAASQESEFTLPGNCRLVILDLGKGDELPSIFAPLVPCDAQRVIVAPQELDATLQPGDVIFLHGGMANEHAERLGLLGRRRIRQHLAEGGSVMGVCAGAHWLSCRDLPLWGHALPLVPHDNQNWRRGIGDLSIDFTGEGQRMLGLNDSVDLRYANGPLLVALDLETYCNYQPGKMPQQESAEEDEIILEAAGSPVPLAVFANCSDAKVTDWATMQGHAAAWAWQTAQGGKAVALSPHPEYHPPHLSITRPSSRDNFSGDSCCGAQLQHEAPEGNIKSSVPKTNLP